MSDDIQNIENINISNKDEEVKKEKEKILKDMELHSRAREIIEHEVQRYGKELFKISQRIARLDGEKDIITTSNVKRAMLSLWKGSSPYRDIFLGIGTTFLGSSLTIFYQCITEYSKSTPLHIIVGLIFLIIGVVGIIVKVKK